MIVTIALLVVAVCALLVTLFVNRDTHHHAPA